MIQVTKPFMPPLEEYKAFMQGIWEREYLTNNGPLVRELEEKLKAYLELPHCLFLANGTIALQIAIKALDLKGEIITTPFSYVATTSSIVWEQCKPVFADIHRETFNIDTALIEDQITEKTSAILATHVFGNPCDIDAIKAIANQYNLKVIYDAAHCFGSTYKEKSVFEYGDISTTSFHATKLFHTVEGGAVFCSDEDLHQRMWYMRNFGHDGPERYNGVGINGKNSELHAAMGLLNLNYIDQVIAKRKEQCKIYQNNLANNGVHFQKHMNHASVNHAYFPVVFEEEQLAIDVEILLNQNKIYPRRYFYPSLNNLDYVEGFAPVSEQVAGSILCLPLYHDLTEDEQMKIIELINKKISQS
jgi:dTDP-4-amino-4,6-dideoxygalactose transaminase